VLRVVPQLKGLKELELSRAPIRACGLQDVDERQLLRALPLLHGLTRLPLSALPCVGGRAFRGLRRTPRLGQLAAAVTDMPASDLLVHMLPLPSSLRSICIVYTSEGEAHRVGSQNSGVVGALREAARKQDCTLTFEEWGPH
jgi:hypothetical protein